MRITVIVRNIAVAAFLLVPLMAGAATLEAQEVRFADTEALDAAVLGHESSERAARAELASFVNDPGVQEIASNYGIDLNRVERAIETLDADEVERLADAAEEVRQNRTTITISVTTIIVILLLILILS